MSKIILLFLICISSISFAAEGVQLRVNLIDNQIAQVAVVNKPGMPINLKINFCIDTIGMLDLIIKDSDDKVHTLDAMINERCNFDREVLLGSSESISRLFTLYELQEYYGLVPGEYKISAKLCPDPTGCIVSNEIIVKIP